MTNPEKPKPRVAIVRILLNGDVSLGTYHVQFEEGETDEQIIQKAKDQIASDNKHMPEDVEFVVESIEDFRKQVIQTHSLPSKTPLDEAVKTKNDPVKFDVAKIEGSFDHVASETKKIVDSDLFLGIECNILGQRLYSAGGRSASGKWAALFVYRRKLTPDELMGNMEGFESVAVKK